MSDDQKSDEVGITRMQQLIENDSENNLYLAIPKLKNLVGKVITDVLLKHFPAGDVLQGNMRVRRFSPEEIEINLVDQHYGFKIISAASGQSDTEPVVTIRLEELVAMLDEVRTPTFVSDIMAPSDDLPAAMSLDASDEKRWTLPPLDAVN